MKKMIFLITMIVGMIPSHNLCAEQILKNITADSTETKVTKTKQDPLGRSNPRGTVNGFFKALSNEDHLRTSKYIDFSNLNNKHKDSITKAVVQRFEFLLNKTGKMSPISVISDSSEGNIDDGLNPAFEEVGSFELNGTSMPIFLESFELNNNQKIWLISWDTIKVIYDDITENKNIYTKGKASDNVFYSKWRGATFSDWIVMLLIAIGSYMIAWFLTKIISWIVNILWPNLKTNKYHDFLKTLLIPLRLVLMVTIIVNVSRLFGISILVRQSFSIVNISLLWIALFIFTWLLINTLSSYGEERLRETNRFGGLSAISFFRNSAKFVLILIALLIALHTIGVNVTAGLAALGIGGIALALGAQKTIENIVGGLSVVFDQPVSVGDFCKFGETVGTVEKIGMRSTRIRTLNRTVVTIPNADFSSQLIENFAKRDLFLLHTVIGLRYETSSDQMRFILVELRKILYAHPKVNPDPARVRFLGYGSDSLQVEIFAYIHAIDYNDFLGIQEDVNLRLAKVIEDSGSGFAFPSQTIYLSKDEGISKDKKEAIENKVKEWIQNNELQIPEFDENTIESLKGTLKYPPKD